jgi:hypothetical protein
MELIKTLAISVLFSGISGCSSMNTPSASLIDMMPVVTIGEVSKVSEDHIVFIPANRQFPIYFSVKGNVFTENTSSKLMVSFKQEMYIYKYWASLDGKKWVNSHKLLNVQPSGGFDASGGNLEVKLDYAN